MPPLLMVACAAGREFDDATSTQSAVYFVLEGQFKLYAEPNHQLDPTCDMYTSLALASVEVGEGTATLDEEFSGFCIGVSSNAKRAFKVKLSAGACGTLIYSGQNETRSITITDYRKSTCAGPAPLVVDEVVTADGRKTTKYAEPSADAPDASTNASNDGGMTMTPEKPSAPCTERPACFSGDRRIGGLDDCPQTAIMCYALTVCGKTAWCLRD